MPADLLTLLSPSNLVLFIIIFTRLSGMMSSSPMISSYPIPSQVKIWFMALISFIIFPLVFAKVGFQVPSTMPELAIILIKEFGIGYIIGFVANLVFVGVEIAADLISVQMGLSASQALNPLTGNTSPMVSQIYLLIASMVFIGLNGYQWLFSAIFTSFKTVPPGYEIIISSTMVGDILVLSGQMFTIAMGIALPIFAVLFMTDVLLGFTSKMMPQMNIFMVSLPLKIYIGLALTSLLISPLFAHIGILMEKSLKTVMAVFAGTGG